MCSIYTLNDNPKHSDNSKEVSETIRYYGYHYMGHYPILCHLKSHSVPFFNRNKFLSEIKKEFNNRGERNLYVDKDGDAKFGYGHRVVYPDPELEEF